MYSGYAVVPIGVVFAVRVARGEHPFSGIRAAPRRRWLADRRVGSCSRRSLGSCNVVLCRLLAVHDRDRRARRPRRRAGLGGPLLAGAVSVVLIGGVLGANLLPSLLYSREHGKNTEVAHRQAAEVDIYGLRVIQLLTPIPDHRLEPLARCRTICSKRRTIPSSRCSSGSSAASGSSGMIGALLVRVARPGAAPTDHGDDDEMTTARTTTSRRRCAAALRCPDDRHHPRRDDGRTGVVPRGRRVHGTARVEPDLDRRRVPRARVAGAECRPTPCALVRRRPRARRCWRSWVSW